MSRRTWRPRRPRSVRSGAPIRRSWSQRGSKPRSRGSRPPTAPPSSAISGSKRGGWMVRASYRILGMIAFFTVGNDEVRAWTITAGTKAQAAAGEIHSDHEGGTATTFLPSEIKRPSPCGSSSGVDCLEVLHEVHELLAHGVARAPALDRGDAVLRGDGLAVVPFRPHSRRVKVHTVLSGETSYLSTICRLTALFSSEANTCRR